MLFSSRFVGYHSLILLWENKLVSLASSFIFYGQMISKMLQFLRVGKSLKFYDYQKVNS